MAEYLGKGIDINSYTENYLRLHLLEVKGGTPVLRSLFLNIVSNSPAKGDADKYLSYFKCDIQRHKHGSVELKVLFPSNGCTNIDKWDVSLLAYVLIHCCTLEGQLSLKGKPNPRELLKKEIEKKGDLSSFLIDNKKELEKLLITSKITQQQYETLYSQDLPTVDFAAWDVELVLHVLFKVCSDTRLLQKVHGACMDVVNRHVKLFSSNIVLDDFLKEYQHIFDEFKKEQQLDDTQYKQIFPNTNASDATQWKSEVLICVVVNTCKYLSQLACNGVKTVRHMRKELGAHTAETNINNDDFLKKWTVLYGAIHNIATEIPETQNNVEVVIRDLLRGPLDIQNSVKYLQQCYANQDTKYDKILEILTAFESNLSIATVITRQLEEIIKQQNELKKEIIKQQIKVKEEIIEQQKKEKEEIIEQYNKLKEDMMLNLDESLRRLPEQNLSAKRDSEAFAVAVDVSGDDINAVENANSSILRAANGCEDDDIQTVKMHTDKIKELLSQDGNEISEAKKRSIILVVKCSSLHGVHSMLRTLNSYELKDRLCQLQKVLSDINTCPIRLGIHLSDSSIKKINGMIKEFAPQSELAVTTDEKENKKIENNILRCDIIKLCNRDDRKEDESILLLGTHGAGKSCIVNTVISALVGKYKAEAMASTGGIAQSKTLNIIMYENCGIIFDDLRDSKYSRFLKTAYGKLPTLVDVAGLDNVNTPALREILQHILGGYIPSGTPITHLMNVQDSYGVGNLDLIYNKCYERWKITKVVFVVSAKEIVPPRKLIECLHSVLAGDSTRSIFVVITRYDRVVNDARDVSDEMQDEQVSNVVGVGVTMKHLEKLEMELANIFSIEGSRDQNMMRWTNYVDDVGYESNPNIDNIALKLLKLMVTPGSPQQDRRPINITLLKRLKIKINNANGAHIQSWHLILAVLVVVVLVVVYKTLSMNV